MPFNIKKERNDFVKVEFEEMVINRIMGETTLYFVAPKEMLDTLYPLDYPEADSAELSLEFPIGRVNVDNAVCSLSPTLCGEDYDWNDIELSRKTIKKLIRASRKGGVVNV